jgi:signal transduction histidine kinase
MGRVRHPADGSYESGEGIPGPGRRGVRDWYQNFNGEYDVLDLSKVEAGKLELVNTDFNLEDCAGQVLRTLGFRARQAGLTLSLQVGPDFPPFLLGDDQRLRQVLMNLIGNAIKFTRNGGISVEISVEPDVQDGLCRISL